MLDFGHDLWRRRDDALGMAEVTVQFGQSFQVELCKSFVGFIEEVWEVGFFEGAQILGPAWVIRVLFAELAEESDALLPVALVDESAVLLEQGGEILFAGAFLFEAVDHIDCEGRYRGQFQIGADIAPFAQSLELERFDQLDQRRWALGFVNSLGTHSLVEIFGTALQSRIGLVAELGELIGELFEHRRALQPITVCQLGDLLDELVFRCHRRLTILVQPGLRIGRANGRGVSFAGVTCYDSEAR